MASGRWQRVDNARGGLIVLMHLGGYETFAALPRVVAGLQAAGYDLVTISELLNEESTALASARPKRADA